MSEFCPRTGDPCQTRALIDRLTDHVNTGKGKRARAFHDKVVERVDRFIGVAQAECSDEICGLAVVGTALAVMNYAVRGDMEININNSAEDKR